MQQYNTTERGRERERYIEGSCCVQVWCKVSRLALALALALAVVGSGSAAVTAFVVPAFVTSARTKAKMVLDSNTMQHSTNFWPKKWPNVETREQQPQHQCTHEPSMLPSIHPSIRLSIHLKVRIVVWFRPLFWICFRAIVKGKGKSRNVHGVSTHRHCLFPLHVETSEHAQCLLLNSSCFDVHDEGLQARGSYLQHQTPKTHK